MKINLLINKVVVILLLSTLTTLVLAQEPTNRLELPTQPKNAIAIVPQYAFFSGIRIDYEKSLKDGDHWIVLAPQIYTDVDGYNNGQNTGGYTSYETMTGFGFNTYFKSIAYKSDKINWKSGLPRHSLYFQAGPNYQFFSLKNTEDVAVPFVEDGTTYYEFQSQEVKKSINRFGAIVDFGWQMAFDRFLLDLYLGLAVKYSFGENGELIRSSYARWVDLDYSGILMDGGVRLGMFF